LVATTTIMRVTAMRFVDRPRPAQLYALSICALALAETALAAWQPTAPAAPAHLFLLLVIAAAVAHSFPISTPGKQSYHVSLPFLVAAVILLSPLQLIGLAIAVACAESFRSHRPTSVQVFNGAALALTGLLAQAVYHALWPIQSDVPADLGQPICLAAGFAAAVTFALVDRVVVSMAIWLGNGMPPRQQQMFEVEGLLTDGVLLLMGVPLAYLMWIAPWVGLVGAAPLWLIHRALDFPNVRAQSRQDGLAELFTAPYFTETCTRELNRGRRFNRPVTLLLLDVDALGELNSAHGNQTGDLVLRATARTISKALREYDLAARLAGGLFAVLLPETDLAQAQVVAERVRRDTAEQRHEVPGSVEQARVTVSIGAAIVSGQGAGAADMFEAARAALARAKRGGGNEIAFEEVHAPAERPHADPPPPHADTLQRLGATPHHAAATRSAASTTSDHPAARAASHREANSRASSHDFSRWLREHPHTAAVCVLAAASTGIFVLGGIAHLDRLVLGVLLSLSALAGFTFYFRSLPQALALVAELNHSNVRLVAARYWRMWPQYVALGAGTLLTLYAYANLGVVGALGVGTFGLLVRNLAGRYVDRTLDSVRKLRNANESLEHQAFHDPLTNLPNRALFAERLEHAMVRAGERSVAVLFVDLDNFKSVNDTLGHAAGDALLIAATERLVKCVRREDTIARLGGDEFTVLLEEMHDPSDAARMAERIGEALRAPFELHGQQVFVSSSIGIALDTDRSHAPHDLMREADLAMYRAKSGGKARYEIFDTCMAERAMQRLGLETELRQAVEKGELVVEYQAVLDVASDDVVAVQARPRWGRLEADELERLAEDTGVAVEVGRWTLQQACRDASHWQLWQPGLGVDVRLADRHLDQPDLVDSVRSTLLSSGLRPSLLRLDVGASMSVETAKALDALGVSLALNDVGVGQLPLEALSSLPFAALQLHPSALDSPDLVRASTALAAALNLSLTAPADRAGVPASAIATLLERDRTPIAA
jgi:diguanylate cyclase (GGDEF)-like protein